jgi:hypothetical protein
MTTQYKRPILPPPEELDTSTRRLRARLDSHAAMMGVKIQRPMAAGELAGNIKKANEARAARVEVTEEQEYARQEILVACGMIQENIQNAREERRADAFYDSVSMFAGAVEEFLKLTAAKSAGSRRDALQAMRDAIETLTLYQQGKP